MLGHCKRCRKTTAFVDGECQRCKFLRAHGLRKAMDPATKEHLRALGKWRRGARATDPRQEAK